MTIERVVVKEVVRSADHRISEVREVHYVMAPPEPPDEALYLTPEEMGDPETNAYVARMAAEAAAGDDEDDRDPAGYPGPAEE